jgi:sugar transferase (PEP-CTERM system associated)
MLRVFHHYISSRKVGFFVVEGLAICAAGLGGALALSKLLSPDITDVGAWARSVYLPIALGLAIPFQLALYLLDMYDLRVAAADQRQGGRLLRAVGLGAILLGLVLAVSPVHLPPGAILGGAAGAFLATLTVRAGLRAVLGQPNRILIIGNGVKAHQVARLIEAEGEGAYVITSFLEPARLGTAAAGEGPSALEIARRSKSRIIVAALDEPRGSVGMDQLLACRLEGLQVYTAAGFCERVLRRIPVAHLKVSDLAFSDELRVSSARHIAKRAFDIVIASILLLLASPVMLLIALAVALDSKGPIFYRQERVGCLNRPYRLWKFRSMRVDAEKDGAVWAKQNDDRVTRVGKLIRRTRIDEIPQVFNVLVGDMSFVGPRPERPVFVEQLKRQIPFFGLREAVKPGITGWAQIRYPYGASVEDARNKLEYDLYYIKNGTLFLDLAIIFHTVRHVLLGRGAR